MRYEYHDALILGRQLGPRREIVLDVKLSPFLNCDAPERVRLRFSGIDNLEEVRSFFEPPLKAAFDEALERIDRLDLIAKGQWVLGIDHRGQVMILSAKPPQEE